MELELVNNHNTLIVRVSGELDLAVAEDFRNQVEGALDKPGINNLILNLKGVSFIDSSGLGVILGRYKRISQQGGVMAVTEASPVVQRILELSGILRIMKAYDDDFKALRAI